MNDLLFIAPSFLKQLELSVKDIRHDVFLDPLFATLDEGIHIATSTISQMINEEDFHRDRLTLDPCLCLGVTIPEVLF